MARAGAKITFAKILGIGAAGLLTDLYSVASTLVLGFALSLLLLLLNLLLPPPHLLPRGHSQSPTRPSGWLTPSSGPTTTRCHRRSA